jgi:predicted secreted Zn-dependent protease
MRIGKTPKKLDSTCCPQCRKTKADILKQLRPIGKGDQELEKRLDQKELT